MPGSSAKATLADQLRQAIHRSNLSFHELGRRAHVDPAQLSRFVAAGRDLTVAVASRLSEVLGLELVQSRSIRQAPLEAPTLTTRRRRKEGKQPEATYPRGQGRR